MTRGTPPEAPASLFHPTGQTPDEQPDSKGGRRNAVFFILAASYLITVLIGLFLNYRTTRISVDSAVSSQRWAFIMPMPCGEGQMSRLISFNCQA